MAHQDRGPAIDETLYQPLMQCVGQCVLYLPGFFAPVIGIFQPVPAIGYERPGPNLADTVGQGVDVTFRILAEADLLGNPVRIDLSTP